MNTNEERAELSPAGEQTQVAEAIRRDSAQVHLTRLSELRSLLERDPLPEIEDSGVEDLKRMDGKAETYFFSELHMTSSYAAYLFRMEEKDLVGLVSETVREDSRVYPRTTPLSFFQGAPFNLAPDRLDDLVGRIRGREDCSDIQENKASNGARYLYSTRYLTPVYADSMTEWIEVGQAENP